MTLFRKPVPNTEKSNINWVDPSCEKAGSYVWTCDDCNEDILIYAEGRVEHSDQIKRRGDI